MNRERDNAAAARRSIDDDGSGDDNSSNSGDGDGDGDDGSDVESVDGDVDDGFGADIPMSGKTVNQHQPSLTQTPVDQATFDDPNCLSPGNDAGVGDDAAETSFTSQHELRTTSNQRPGYNRMRRRQLAKQFAMMEKNGQAAKLFHNETAGSSAAANAAAGSAANGALPGASAAPNTVDRQASFGKGKQIPPPLPPADVDRNSLRAELMDRLMYRTAL
eukprot:502721-Pleurochrysis_carterae.AAC.2